MHTAQIQLGNNIYSNILLRCVANPLECTIFGRSCKPNTPIGSCMVSSEGACAAYYKYGNLI